MFLKVCWLFTCFKLWFAIPLACSLPVVPFSAMSIHLLAEIAEVWSSKSKTLICPVPSDNKPMHGIAKTKGKTTWLDVSADMLFNVLSIAAV